MAAYAVLCRVVPFSKAETFPQGASLTVRTRSSHAIIAQLGLLWSRAHFI